MTADYESTYDQIREGKIITMKNIFRKLSGFEKCSDAFTDDELVKSFDFFNRHAEKKDDDIADNGMWVDFLEVSKDFLSKKSHKFLWNCNG
jgi:hypothetical protein